MDLSFGTNTRVMYRVLFSYVSFNDAISSSYNTGSKYVIC